MKAHRQRVLPRAVILSLNVCLDFTASHTFDFQRLYVVGQICLSIGLASWLAVDVVWNQNLFEEAWCKQLWMISGLGSGMLWYGVAASSEANIAIVSPSLLCSLPHFKRPVVLHRNVACHPQTRPLCCFNPFLWSCYYLVLVPQLSCWGLNHCHMVFRFRS